MFPLLPKTSYLKSRVLQRATWVHSVGIPRHISFSNPNHSWQARGGVHYWTYKVQIFIYIYIDIYDKRSCCVYLLYSYFKLYILENLTKNKPARLSLLKGSTFLMSVPILIFFFIFDHTIRYIWLSSPYELSILGQTKCKPRTSSEELPQLKNMHTAQSASRARSTTVLCLAAGVKRARERARPPPQWHRNQFR